MDDACTVSGGRDLHVRIMDRLGCSLLHSGVFPGVKLAAKPAERNAMIRRRFELESPSRAPVAQWIEQPPPKGQVARSIRVWGATLLYRLKRSASAEGGHAPF